MTDAKAEKLSREWVHNRWPIGSDDDEGTFLQNTYAQDVRDDMEYAFEAGYRAAEEEMKNEPRPVLALLSEYKERVAKLEDIHAEAALVFRDAKCVMLGLDQGIVTVPNAIIHRSLKFTVPRLEKALAALSEPSKGGEG